MIDLSKTHSALGVLQEWLTENDFRQPRSGRPLVTSDDYAEWVSQSLRVEMRWVRGESYLGLGMRTMANSYHPDEWEAWLERLPMRRHLSDLDHQVEFITQRWLRAVRLAQADIATTEAALEGVGLDWVQRRFGWRPPGD